MNDSHPAPKRPPMKRWPPSRWSAKDWAFVIALAVVATLWCIGQLNAFRFQLRLFR